MSKEREDTSKPWGKSDMSKGTGNKGRRPKKGRNRNYRDEQRDEKTPTSNKYNDASWYAKNAQMLNDAASYSYNNPVGSPIRLGFQGIQTQASNTLCVPSIMEINVLLTPGQSQDSVSAANLAANNIYSFVRYHNSGAKNYDQADLMLYLLAMDNLYSFWNWAKRIYGYAMVYSQYNRTMPECYAAVDGVDLADIAKNLADYRLFLNRAASQISSFCVPATMPYFIRHSWMFSNIYKDSDNNKAQQFMFTTKGFYRYSETGEQYGGQLDFYPLAPSAGLTVKMTAIIQYFNKMLEAVAYSEDIGVMSGDILKAYGEGALFKLSAVDPEYRVEPVYQEEVLNQIHNLTIVPLNVQKNKAVSIAQNPDTGYIVFNPNQTWTGAAWGLNRVMINMPWDNVTPDNTMVGTRLTAMYHVETGATENTIVVDAFGTEIITACVIYTWNPVDNNWITVSSVDGPFINVNGTNVNFMNNLTYLMLLTNFDWHPLAYAVNATAEASNFLGVIGDVTNYTTMDVVDLEKLHLTATLSEFNVPQLSAF